MEKEKLIWNPTIAIKCSIEFTVINKNKKYWNIIRAKPFWNKTFLKIFKQKLKFQIKW